MRDKDLKNLIKKIEKESDHSKMAEIFDAEGQKELADFVRLASGIKHRIEPDRSLLLRILNDISDKRDEKNDASVPVINKVRFQLKVHGWLKFAVPTALIILATIVIWQNPFNSEQSQMTELKNITKEEKAADQANNSLKSYITSEKQSAQLGQSGTSSSSTPAVAINVTSPFDSAAIASEAGALNFDPGLTQFISQEKSMSTVDATLLAF
jgi:hypothetical protein